MSAHTFTSHICSVRDHGLSLRESWFTRFNDEATYPDWFELWSIVPFEQLTVDDVVWAIMAAAMNPDVATLAYFVFPGQCTEPEQKVEELVRGLVELGFSPYGFDWLLEETDGDNVLLLSVFSEREAYHVQDLYYPLD